MSPFNGVHSQDNVSFICTLFPVRLASQNSIKLEVQVLHLVISLEYALVYSKAFR